MRSLSLLFSIVAIFGLSACTTVPPSDKASVSVEEPISADNQTVAESETEKHQEYLERIAAVSKEIRGLCAASVNQSYFKKTPCLPTSITQEQLKDRTHISKEQKKAAQRIFARQKELNSETRLIMIESGDPDMIHRARFSETQTLPKIEELQQALLNGTMTWGEYNRLRLEIFEESRNDATNE